MSWKQALDRQRKKTDGGTVRQVMPSFAAQPGSEETVPGKRRRTGTDLSRFTLLGVLALTIVVFSIALPQSFPTAGNFSAILLSQAVTLILSMGLLVALRSGDFDLSIAATMNFSAAILAVLTVDHHVSLGLAIVVALGVSALIGVANAVLIVGAGLNAFVMTLGMQTLLYGLTYGVTSTAVIVNIPHALVSFTSWSIGPIPGSAVYGWIIAIVIWYAFERLPIGRYLQFIGGNREAAQLLGLPVARIRAGAFIICALLAGFAGIVLAGTLGAVDPSAGPQYLLPPYAGAFLGTVAIQVGRFNVLGTVIGTYLLVTGVTGLELAGAPSWISDVFNGGALIGAIVIARLFGQRGDS